MTKRGQVTVFIILGVIILILAALFLYLRESKGLFVPSGQYLQSQLTPIQTNVEECVTTAVGPGIILLGKQGGSFSPGNYRLYDGNKVKYFCTNLPGKDQCLNMIPSLASITEDFKTYLQFQVDSCVDKQLLDDLGVDVEGSKQLNVLTTFNQGTLLVETTYDVTLKRDQERVRFPPLKKTYDAPLEELYFVSRDIVQSQATTGDFEQLTYMLNRKGLYEIQVDKPFPDTIYKLNKKNSNYQFWFAIEGESS